MLERKRRGRRRTRLELMESHLALLNLANLANLRNLSPRRGLLRHLNHPVCLRSDFSESNVMMPERLRLISGRLIPRSCRRTELHVRLQWRLVLSLLACSRQKQSSQSVLLSERLKKAQDAKQAAAIAE